MRYLLAHDIGTSGDKATLFAEDGTLIGSILGEYPTHYDRGGVVEQHPEDWWRAVCETTREMAKLVDKKSIAAVSFGGQQMGCACIDREGRPLRSSIIWADTRSVQEEKYIEEVYGRDAFYRKTGHRLSASHTITKLMWVRDHQPEIYKKTYKTLNSKDYIVLKLTGKFMTDYSDASGTLAFDAVNCCWAEDLIQAAGLELDKFPEVRSGLEVVGEVTPQAAEECGLAAGTPVVLGGGDGHMCAVGAGCASVGEISCNLGTSAFIGVMMDYPIADEQQRIVSWNSLIPGTVTVSGTMQAFGASVAWMRDNLCHEELARSKAEGVSRYTYINENSLKSPLGSNGLLFLPYLQGERAPHWDAHAKGAFVGLTMKHTANDMKRAVFEGVAMNMGLIYNILKENISDKMPKKIIVTGGGANSPVVQQTLADLFEAQILLTDVSDIVGSLGAAVAAGYGVGIYKDMQQARKIMKITKTIDPIPENTARFREILPVFSEAYTALKGIFPKLTF